MTCRARTLLVAAPMAKPRFIAPGATYLVTRRCAHRSFRLRPSAETNAIIAYCLALAVEKSGVDLHAVCVMSNHHHLVVSDPHAKLPVFLRELHRSIAKALNIAHREDESLWASEQCNVVLLVTENDVAEKIAYVVANPVSAGLVQEPPLWPGLNLWEPGEWHAARPGVYFAEDGETPASLPLKLVAHPRFRDRERQRTWRKVVENAVARRVLVARTNVRKSNRTFLGRAAILAQSFARRASSIEPRRPIVPTVAARDADARIGMLRRLRDFRGAYRSALERWRAGDRDVVFPGGTWWMRVHHDVRCVPLSGHCAA